MGKIINRLIYVIYFVFIAMTLYSIMSISTKKYNFMYLVIAVVIFILYVLARKKKINFQNKVLRRIICGISGVCVVVGFVARIGLIFITYIEPFSDYLTFYANAASYASTSSFINNDYIALFPYLSPYIFVLGNIFKILGTGYKSVVIFNVFLDILAGIILFFIFRNKENRLKAIVALAVWMINPFNIMWCSFAAPITIVNFFFVVSFFLFEKREKVRESQKQFLIFSVLLGIILGIANQFRPIFIIFIIALLIYEIYKILFEKKVSKTNLLIGILIVLIMYFICGKAIFYSMQKINRLEFAQSSGWTVYLGANIEAKGTWNPEDSAFLSEVIAEKGYDSEGVQKELMDSAIKRYKQNGIKNNINLMKDKFEVLTGDMAKYSVDAWWYIQELFQSEKLNTILLIVTRGVYIILILFNLVAVYDRTKIKRQKFYVLLVMGLLASHLLVEVSPRYNLHTLVPMQIIMILLLEKDYYYE